MGHLLNTWGIRSMDRFLKHGIVIAIGILVVTSIVQSLFISSAYALTRYFNCVTRIANGNGTMSLDNVKGCYYKVFQGARDADADGHKIKIK
jgi:hypothetical protein